MINEARGLDYFLLPSLFADCLDTESLLHERDEWFSAHPKYGPTYVAGLGTMQEAGVVLVPDFGMISGRDEYLPESFDVKLGAGRKAHTEDQPARAGGLPRSSMADLATLVPESGQHISRLIANSEPLESMAPLHPQRGDDDYDTEVEEDLKRRHRRPPATPAKLKLETSQSRGVPRHITRIILEQVVEAENGLNARTENTVVDIDVKPVIPVVRTAAPDRKRPRFSVDKEHLRALSTVCKDVDDL